MTYQKKWLFLIIGLACLLVLGACATPTSRIHEYARFQDFQPREVQSHGFAHLVFTKNIHNTRKDNARSVLHVYLEGDGSPWKYRVVTMPDPTPRDPLMLRLMARDSSAVAYVGRPCYNGAARDQGCDKSVWTSGRYSASVVRSMTGVIQSLVDEHGFDDVKLIGHSGGGTLAMLIAYRVPQVSHVITLAGNLDTDGWTRHHGYTKLYTSLNPAKQPKLAPHILQWHLVGGRDSVIPPAIVQRFIHEQPNALGIAVQNFSHSCCWESVWPNVLSGIKSSAAGFLPGVRFKLPSKLPKEGFSQ